MENLVFTQLSIREVREMIREETTAALENYFSTHKKEELLPFDSEKAQILSIRVIDAGLSIRAQNALINYGVLTLGDIMQLEVNPVRKFRNFGKGSYKEVCMLLEIHGLKWRWAPKK